MLTGPREELRRLLAETATTRPPALRRSDDPDALLATDLPLVAEEAAVGAFVDRTEKAGWTVWTKKGWLLLDRPLLVPEAPIPQGTRGELGCCLSLLIRHPSGEADARDIRAIVKAAEAGQTALERLCGRFHAAWAAELREHRLLPGGLLPWLCRAYEVTGASPLSSARLE